MNMSGWVVVMVNPKHKTYDDVIVTITKLIKLWEDILHLSTDCTVRTVF